MITDDPNVRSVALVAAALGDLCDDLVLVGGCAASLLIDAPTAPPPRVTYDVDLIAAVTALRDYYALEAQFVARGFQQDLAPDAPVCRWRMGSIQVDLMPTDKSVLGFTNPWYATAAATARRQELPGGLSIKLIAAPAFLATKFEAFRTRGQADLLQSHDFEDIVNIIEGRLSIVEEVNASNKALRNYLGNQFVQVRARADFFNVLPGLVAFDELHTQRLARVHQRIAALAAMGNP